MSRQQRGKEHARECRNRRKVCKSGGPFLFQFNRILFRPNITDLNSKFRKKKTNKQTKTRIWNQLWNQKCLFCKDTKGSIHVKGVCISKSTTVKAIRKHAFIGSCYISNLTNAPGGPGGPGI